MAFEFSSPPNLFDASKLTTGTLLTGRLPALSGDIFSLVGSNLLYLVDSGVIAGTYTNASLIVDSKGRILSAGNGTPNSSITSGGNVEFSGSLDSGRVTYSAVGDERFFPTNSTLNVYLSASQNLYSSLSSGYIALSSSYAGLVTNYNYLSSIKENLIIPGTTSQYYRGDKTFQTLDKNAVGLSNVDNTSDADKPISNATQAVLSAKAGLDAPVFTGAPTITNFTNAAHTHTNFSNGGLLSAAAIGYGTLNPSLFPAFSGDITTNIGGVSASLSNTGVIAGIYSNASISVDSKGRILSAGSGALNSGNSGDVVGPSSSFDGEMAVFSGTTGKIIKNGGALSAWNGSTALTTVGTITTGLWTATPITSSYIDKAVYWNSKVDAGQISASNLTMNGPYILGRYSAGTGAFQYIPIGNNLVLNSGGLSATGGAGKQTIYIPAWAMTTRTTSGAAVGTVETSANKVMIDTYDFDAINTEYVQFKIRMPKSWDGGFFTHTIDWSHASTTTNFGVVWEMAALAVSDGENIDQAFGPGASAADVGGQTNYRYQTTESATFSASNSPTFGDLFIFQICRKPSDASDTLAIDARLWGATIHYTTDKSNDA